MRGRCGQQRRAEGEGDLRQFCGSRARGSEIISGQQNLDGCRQHSGATDLFLCIEESAPDRRGRRVDLTLRQTEQRQSWLRLTSALVRTRVGLFRLGELASKSMDFAAPIERRSRRRPRDQELTRALCVARGLVPLAPQLQDFGAVEQTFAAIAHEIGLRRAPLRKRGRPFIRAPQIERLPTAFQHAAVDIAGHEWGHLTCDHRSHRFIEERDTFGNASEADERATTSVAGHRRQIAIGKAASDLRRLAECGVRRRGITLHDAFDGDRDQQIASDDAVELPLIQQAAGSYEPAGCGSDSAPFHERKPEPERRSSGPFTVSAIEEGLMRACGDGLALVIPAHQVGRDRESLEVFGVERCVTISGLQ